MNPELLEMLDTPLWEQYCTVIEANKAQRKARGEWAEWEPQEVVFIPEPDREFEVTLNDGTRVKDTWPCKSSEQHWLSKYLVMDLLGTDWMTVDKLLLRQREGDMRLIGDTVYYREEAVADSLKVLKCLAKTQIVNSLRPLPQMVKGLNESVYTNQDMMNILDVKENTLRKYRNDGYLGYSCKGDKYWYTESDLKAFLNHPKIKREPFA